MDMIEIVIEDGVAVAIYKNDLARITDEQLEALHISRAELHRVFAEGIRLMREHDVRPGDRVRPCADETLDGKWIVQLIEYSPFNDPLLNGPVAGNA
jgi:hypothetical protein